MFRHNVHTAKCYIVSWVVTTRMAFAMAQNGLADVPPITEGHNSNVVHKFSTKSTPNTGVSKSNSKIVYI